MATFTEQEQKRHREAFIEESKQKAWGAACNAEWVAKELESLTTQYAQLEKELSTVEEEIKTTDYKTPENREKLKTLQTRRAQLPEIMKSLKGHIATGQHTVTQLYNSVETNLSLAEHAKTWEWKEAQSTESPERP